MISVSWAKSILSRLNKPHVFNPLSFFHVSFFSTEFLPFLSPLSLVWPSTVERRGAFFIHSFISRVFVLCGFCIFPVYFHSYIFLQNFSSVEMIKGHFSIRPQNVMRCMYPPLNVIMLNGLLYLLQ